MTTPEAFTPEPVRENYLKGALFALIALPVGVILWVVIWMFGFIASIVALVIAAAAAWLYRKGSGGKVSVLGALIVTGVVVVTLLVAFWAGIVADFANAVAVEIGGTAFDALSHPLFWPFFSENFAAVFAENLGNFGLALLFGALGAFGVLRSTFMGAKQAAAGPAVAEQPATEASVAPPAAVEPTTTPWAESIPEPIAEPGRHVAPPVPEEEQPPAKA